MASSKPTVLGSPGRFPFIVGVYALWPAALIKFATGSSSFPVCHAPWTSTYVPMVTSLTQSLASHSMVDLSGRAGNLDFASNWRGEDECKSPKADAPKHDLKPEDRFSHRLDRRGRPAGGAPVSRSRCSRFNPRSQQRQR